jgi:hypothetical protein
MATERRVVCGITGAALLLAVVWLNDCSNAQPYRDMFPFDTSCRLPAST